MIFSTIITMLWDCKREHCWSALRSRANIIKNDVFVEFFKAMNKNTLGSNVLSAQNLSLKLMNPKSTKYKHFTRSRWSTKEALTLINEVDVKYTYFSKFVDGLIGPQKVRWHLTNFDFDLLTFPFLDACGSVWVQWEFLLSTCIHTKMNWIPKICRAL